MKLNVQTDQQAFDAVVRHLSEMRQRSVDLAGNCRYRTDDGNRCAIGALIDDDQYDPNMEGKTVSTLIHRFQGVTPFIETDINTSLLYDLQRVHDIPENWTSDDPDAHTTHLNLNGLWELREIAMAYRLTPPLLAPA